MLSRVTLEAYRRMTTGERLALTLEMTRENTPYLLRGTPEDVARRFELIRRENDERNKNMLTAFARTKPSPMQDLTRTLRDIADIFESLQAPYAVIGVVATAIYGIPHVMREADVLTALPPSNRMTCFELAAKADFTVEDLPNEARVKLRRSTNDRAIEIDIHLAESPFYTSLLARRRSEEIEGETFWFVGPEDLILLKLVAGRPRDFGDITDIFFMQGQLDEAYLRQWAAELGVTERLELALRDARGDADTATN